MISSLVSEIGMFAELFEEIMVVSIEFVYENCMCWVNRVEMCYITHL